MPLARHQGYDDLDALWDAAPRFWERVNRVRGGCWGWTGTFMTSGYGEFNYRGRKIGAHRFSYLLHIGELEAGKCICHQCDNRFCVNPRHLYQGTYRDNFDDILKRYQESLIPGPALSEEDWGIILGGS